MGLFPLVELNVTALRLRKDVDGLVRALGPENDYDVREAAADALGEIGDPRAVDPLSAAPTRRCSDTSGRTCSRTRSSSRGRGIRHGLRLPAPAGGLPPTRSATTASGSRPGRPPASSTTLPGSTTAGSTRVPGSTCRSSRGSSSATVGRCGPSRRRARARRSPSPRRPRDRGRRGVQSGSRLSSAEHSASAGSGRLLEAPEVLVEVVPDRERGHYLPIRDDGGRRRQDPVDRSVREGNVGPIALDHVLAAERPGAGEIGGEHGAAVDTAGIEVPEELAHGHADQRQVGEPGGSAVHGRHPAPRKVEESRLGDALHLLDQRRVGKREGIRSAGVMIRSRHRRRSRSGSG